MDDIRCGTVAWWIGQAWYGMVRCGSAWSGLASMDRRARAWRTTLSQYFSRNGERWFMSPGCGAPDAIRRLHRALSAEPNDSLGLSDICARTAGLPQSAYPSNATQLKQKDSR
jgi:hypothetical protein